MITGKELLYALGAFLMLLAMMALAVVIFGVAVGLFWSVFLWAGGA